MENIYLTLYRSDPTREMELLLRWNMFKGFDNISLSNTDHFLIYCKSAPVMYASMTPSRNIFNCLYPALCKQPNQRYACVVVSKLKTNADNVNTNIIKKDDSNETRSSDSDSDDSLKDNNLTTGSQLNNNKSTHQLRNIKSTLLPPSNRSNAVGQLKTTTSTSTPSPMKQHKDTTNNTNNNDVKPRDVGLLLMENNNKNANAKSSTTNTLNNGVKSTSSSSEVNDYLLEFSALSEVLFVTPNRLPCLRYAITRFGTMTDPALYVPMDGKMMTTMDGKSGGAVDSKQVVAPTKVISSVLQNHMYIKNPYENPADRVLLELSSGEKRICIMPLFNWILINDETIQTLDFTNCFNEQSQEMIFLQEELEHNRLAASAIGLAVSTIGTKSKVTKEKLENSNGLYKVFNEVDLLETDKLLDNLTRSNQKFALQKASSDAMDRAIITNKSLKMLETELGSRELNVNVKATVVKMRHQRAIQEEENAKNIMNKHEGSPTKDDDDDISIVEKTQMQIDARLTSLNASASAQLKVVDNHNQLCEVEHKAFENDFSPTKPSTSKEQTEKLIENRMGIIEHLQKIRFEKVTLETVINNYNAHRHKSLLLDETNITTNANPSSSSGEDGGGSPASTMKNKNRLKTFSNLPSSSSNNNNNNSSVNAGKRLAESIQALAETLNAKVIK